MPAAVFSHTHPPAGSGHNGTHTHLNTQSEIQLQIQQENPVLKYLAMGQQAKLHDKMWHTHEGIKNIWAQKKSTPGRHNLNMPT